MDFLSDLAGPDTLLLDRAAIMAGVNPQTLRKWIDDGRLRGWRTHRGKGNKIVVLASELAEAAGATVEELHKRSDEHDERIRKLREERAARRGGAR